MYLEVLTKSLTQYYACDSRVPASYADLRFDPGRITRHRGPQWGWQGVDSWAWEWGSRTRGTSSKR